MEQVAKYTVLRLLGKPLKAKRAKVLSSIVEDWLTALPTFQWLPEPQLPRFWEMVSLLS
jgi:hypothetical protein